MQWWVIWANNQPVKGVGVTASVFYGSKAQAGAKASAIVDGTVTGPYGSKAAALAAIRAAGGSGDNSAVTSPPPGPQAPLSTQNPLALVGDFLARLSSPHTWLRVAEAVTGIAFLIIGLNTLLHNPVGKVASITPAGRAAKTVKVF